MNEQEILELMLSCASEKEIDKTAKKLLESFGCLNSVFNADIKHILNDDISEQTAAFIKLVKNVSLDYILNKGQRVFLTNPARISDYFKNLYVGASEERCYIVAVSSNKMVIGTHLVSVGNSNSVAINKEKILHYVMGVKPYGIFISHNHPIQDSTPSSADIDLTENVVKTLTIYNIKVFDHIIIGNYSSLTSMKNLICNIKFSDW